jgi:hypothetical protein
MAESFTRPYRQIFTGQKQNNARVPVALEAQAHVVSADMYVEAQHPFVFPRPLLQQFFSRVKAPGNKSILQNDKRSLTEPK